MAFNAKTMLMRRQVGPIGETEQPMHKRMYQHRRPSASGINDSSICSQLNATQHFFEDKDMLVKPRDQSESVLKNTLQKLPTISLQWKNITKRLDTSQIWTTLRSYAGRINCSCKVREALFIKKETIPTLNRDGGVNFQKSTIHI